MKFVSVLLLAILTFTVPAQSTQPASCSLRVGPLSPGFQPDFSLVHEFHRIELSPETNRVLDDAVARMVNYTFAPTRPRFVSIQLEPSGFISDSPDVNMLNDEPFLVSLLERRSMLFVDGLLVRGVEPADINLAWSTEVVALGCDLNEGVVIFMN